MADTPYTGRKTWEAPRRYPPKPSARSRLVRLARRLSFNARRYAGLIALAALAVGAVLVHAGYLHASFGKSRTEHLAAIAIDGDSLRAAGREIRIAGIDAPEFLQTCLDEHGGTWACGRQAHAFLRGFVSSGTLTCTSNSTDRYGRMLAATCSAGDVGDIGDAMVRAGYAVSFMGIGYWPAEFEARWNKRGIWRGTFDQPRDWRGGIRGSAARRSNSAHRLWVQNWVYGPFLWVYNPLIFKEKDWLRG